MKLKLIRTLVVTLAGMLVWCTAGCQTSGGDRDAGLFSANEKKIDDMADQASQLFIAGKWKEAAAGFEGALKLEKDETMKVALIQMAGMSRMACKDYAKAGELFDQAASLRADNDTIANARVVCWTKAKDPVHLAAAQNQLSHVSPGGRGDAVAEPITTIVVLGAVAKGADEVWTHMDEKTKKKLIKNTINNADKACDEVVDTYKGLRKWLKKKMK